MEASRCVPLILLTFLAVLYQTESLRCYKCKPCNDPFKANNVANLTIVNCNGTCLKAVTEFHDLGLYMSRDCSSNPEKNTCRDDRGSNEVCTCDSDLCNGSPAIVSAPVTTGVIVLLSAFLNTIFPSNLL